MKFIPNAASGNMFAIFAETEQHLIGIRYWVDFSKTDTLANFRVRVVENSSAEVSTLNMLHSCQTQFPEITWTGGGAEHASFSGAMMIAGMVPPAAIADAVISSEVLTPLYEDIIKRLNLSIAEIMPLHHFEDVFSYYINEQFPKHTGPTSVVLQFAGFKKSQDVLSHDETTSEAPSPL